MFHQVVLFKCDNEHRKQWIESIIISHTVLSRNFDEFRNFQWKYRSFEISAWAYINLLQPSSA